MAVSANPGESLAGEIVAHLRGVRSRLAEEIRSYPTPIPRCDAQFNHLYEQLGRLARDLGARRSGGAAPPPPPPAGGGTGRPGRRAPCAPVRPPARRPPRGRARSL